MRPDSLKTSFGLLLIVTSTLLCSHPVCGQARCLSDDDIKIMLAQVNSSQNVSYNKSLRDKLLKLKEDYRGRFQGAIAAHGPEDAFKNRMNEAKEKNTTQLCQILKKFGWPSPALVGKDGVAAFVLLLKNSSSIELQRDLLPVMIAAVRKNEVEKPDFAGYIDKLRLSAGLKQLFGNEAMISNGFLVLYPIENEAQVNERRRQYDLPPLAAYLRFLEGSYGLPLVKSQGALTSSFADGRKNAIAKTTSATLFKGQSAEESEVIRVDTKLVSLNVSVYSQNLKIHLSTLQQKDFAVSEDGRAETITFFSTTDVPFDLVLLIDLSGSTSGQRNLIRKTTQHFIEAARQSDRIAIVTFSDAQTIICPLTADHQTLLESINRIDGSGGSNVWDALKFTLDQVFGPKLRTAGYAGLDATAQTFERRKAVVFMTDGADNSLLSIALRAVGFGGRGSKTSYAELLETVRRSDTLVIPIYLDTEGSDSVSHDVYANARKMLARLAEESGGLYYKARKIEDLNGIYAQVIEDLGKVYSLGYTPTNDKHDGSWRSVTVKIPSRPDLMTRAKPGYYAE